MASCFFKLFPQKNEKNVGGWRKKFHYSHLNEYATANLIDTYSVSQNCNSYIPHLLSPFTLHHLIHIVFPHTQELMTKLVTDTKPYRYKAASVIVTLLELPSIAFEVRETKYYKTQNSSIFLFTCTHLHEQGLCDRCIGVHIYIRLTSRVSREILVAYFTSEGE